MLDNAQAQLDGAQTDQSTGSGKQAPIGMQGGHDGFRALAFDLGTPAIHRNIHSTDHGAEGGNQ